MESALQTRTRKSLMKGVLVFVMHQFIGTIGVGMAAAILVSFSFILLRPLNPHFFTEHEASVLLRDLPYFPAQILCALWSGFWIGRRLNHRSMLWVWVIPLVVLACALLMWPMTPVDLSSVVEKASASRSVLSHYFGSACKPENMCLDQSVITLPFYAACSYSIGAFVARRVAAKRRATILF